MEREKVLTEEEIVSRILGLPMDRIEFLKQEHDMPVADPLFSEWFVENAALVLEELKTYGPIAQWRKSLEKTPEAV